MSYECLILEKSKKLDKIFTIFIIFYIIILIISNFFMYSIGFSTAKKITIKKINNEWIKELKKRDLILTNKNGSLKKWHVKVLLIKKQ